MTNASDPIHGAAVIGDNKIHLTVWCNGGFRSASFDTDDTSTLDGTAAVDALGLFGARLALTTSTTGAYTFTITR